MLVDTIDPNRVVDHRFIEYTVLTTDGLQIVGMLFEEPGNSITLADVKGESHVVLRNDLDELVSNNRSHMPERLEGKLTLQQMADLIAFIANTVTFNGENTVTAEPDSTIRLPDTERPEHQPRPGLRRNGIAAVPATANSRESAVKSSVFRDIP